MSTKVLFKLISRCLEMSIVALLPKSAVSAQLPQPLVTATLGAF